MEDQIRNVVLEIDICFEITENNNNNVCIHMKHGAYGLVHLSLAHHFIFARGYADESETRNDSANIAHKTYHS